MSIEQERIVIESLSPQVDGGRYDVKAVVGDRIEVGADIWKDGHELLKAAVLWRKLDAAEQVPRAGPSQTDLARSGWREERMSTCYEANDRWSASFAVDELGPHAYTVVAWTDVFGSWRSELEKKAAAGQGVGSELREGLAIVDAAFGRARGRDREALGRFVRAIREAPDEHRAVAAALDDRLAALMDRHDARADLRRYDHEIPIWVDRERARYGSWYEIFPRSQGTVAGRSATFREAEARLPEIAAMGFDVLYLTPIHPIGRAHRKGKNGSEHAEPGEPGSPWAIGGPEGGHEAVHPELGTIGDFDHFRTAAARLGLEIALDFAINCSPDHPWVREHPAWFSHRPDGTIKYAENPPKKYQDIYPINFETPQRDGLYQALLGVLRFWIGHGVKIFRVDNPHTKPVSFWKWLIDSVHRDHPEVLFLAEAFTRPKRMHRLAKVGFTQSYTYFTWRNARSELEEYSRELFLTDVRLFLRPNFFANTPDILHRVLQEGGRPAFLQRLVLAATLSPSYGIYSGFELCENRALGPGSEEYLDSEKYQYKIWDWHRAGNIIAEVARINRIRREHRALQTGSGLRVLESTNPEIIAYAKATADLADVLVVAVNLDPFQVQEGTIRVPAELYGGAEQGEYAVTDLLAGERYRWRGERNYVRLDPHKLPAHVLEVERPGSVVVDAAPRR
ncbi:MAG: alpha-1,4-glucan--maltose-1-phosphate maltosyltransferase [Deltaproteobacteria bacterium]|nr:alpha-1,4-glucan--maltose-1-phosphate maltosyltransferase [Deltaproteobacteria bacterium]